MVELLAYDDGIYLRWMLNSVGLRRPRRPAWRRSSRRMCGYALAKYRFRGREAMFNVVLGGVLVPATALALPLFLLFSQVQLTNTFWAVFLPSIVSPFGVYLARVFADASVPDELLEASRLDGAGEVRTFFTVSIRLMLPALITIFLFQFVGDLEQLLPAAHHAAQRGAVPGDLRPLRVELDHQPVPRAAHVRPDRRPAVDHPPDRHLPSSSALLAHGPRHRRAEVTDPRRSPDRPAPTLQVHHPRKRDHASHQTSSRRGGDRDRRTVDGRVLRRAVTAASGSDAAACAPSDGDVTLTFTSWIPGIEDAVAIWNEANPDIQVEVQTGPNGNAGTYQNFFNQLEAGNAPDLGQIEYDAIPNFRVQDGLEDLAACEDDRRRRGPSSSTGPGVR